MFVTRPLQFFFVVLVGVTTLGCEDEQLGQACGTEASALPNEPIVNEIPVVEVVRMERDAVCESFKCLRHAGLDPYCTRTCKFKRKDDDSKSCTTDDDCTPSNYCVDGTCRDDDCPAGFRCTEVQESGPLAGERYCIKQTGCESNLDCEDLGNVVCNQRGCLDACLLAGDACTTDFDCRSPLRCDAQTGLCACDNHLLVCASMTEDDNELPFCNCPPGEASCSDTDLFCQPPGAAEAWEPGSVRQTSFCEPTF